MKLPEVDPSKVRQLNEGTDPKKYRIPSVVMGVFYGAFAFGLINLLNCVPSFWMEGSLLMSAMFGVVFFFLGWFMTVQARGAQASMDRIDQLEKDVDGCEDPQELRRLRRDVLAPLAKEGVRSSKLKEINAVILTKLKYLEPDK